MATSTLVQYLPAGEAPDTSNRGQTETFIARETVAVGDWVAFDYAATASGDITRGIFKADANSTPVRTPFGVVIGSADRDASGTPLFTAGSRIIVVISGVAIASCSDNAGAGNAVGTLLQITNTAGTADVASAASAQPVCGVLSETIAAAAGTVLRRVVVTKNF
tara:strand:- start:212 stop:703 length:492 start_codon:yes stop_codon:yes gene_type:complete